MLEPGHNNQDIDKIINNIMDANGYRHHYEVAEYFMVSAQTLSGWVKQQKIPPKHLLKYYNDFNQDKPAQRVIHPQVSTTTNNNLDSRR